MTSDGARRALARLLSPWPTDAELQAFFGMGPEEWSLCDDLDRRKWAAEAHEYNQRVMNGKAHVDTLGDGEYATMPDIAYGDGSDAEALEWHRNLGGRSNRRAE